MTNIGIVGSGDFAREVCWLIERINRVKSFGDVSCFIGEGPAPGEKLLGKPVMLFEQAMAQYPDMSVVNAIADPAIRAKIAREAQDHGVPFLNLVDPSAIVAPDAVLGTGVIICAASTISVGCSIGDHAIINFDCSIGHDARVGDYCTLSPGCHISGRNMIGHGTFLGTGVMTAPGLSIGSGCDVVLGSVVTRNLPDNVLSGGNPAVLLSQKRKDS